HRLGAPPQWWLVVLATTVWSAAYLDGQGALQVVLPALFAVGCAWVWRAPVAAAALVGAAQAVGLLAGVPTESPAGLLAGLVCLLALGSTTGLRRALPVLGLYVAVIAVTGLPALRTAVGVLLFGGTWAVADQLRRRRRRV